MSISILTQYPGKVGPVVAGWPYGEPRNITAPGDGLGTPWEAALVKDIVGLQQALVTSAGITPSGTPDQVAASEYLQAIIELASGRAYNYDESGVANTYVLDIRTGQQAPASYYDGMKVRFTPGNTSNGASTINVNGLGIKSITLDGTAAITGDALLAGIPVVLVYNGVNFQFERLVYEESGSITFSSLASAASSTTTNVAHSLGTDNIEFTGVIRGGTWNVGNGNHVVRAQLVRPDGGEMMIGFDNGQSPPIVLALPPTGNFAIRAKNDSSVTQDVIVDYTIKRRLT